MRLDRVVDAAIAEVRSVRRTAAVFLLLFSMVGIVFLAIGNPVAGGIILGAPTVAIIRATWAQGDRSSGSSHQQS
jgi:hypothetical protein